MVLMAAQRIMASEWAGLRFVVAGEPSVRGDPGQRPFHRPSARQDTEALLAFGFADDVHDDAQDACRVPKPRPDL
jgi:hypothetical protein